MVALPKEPSIRDRPCELCGESMKKDIPEFLMQGEEFGIWHFVFPVKDPVFKEIDPDDVWTVCLFCYQMILRLRGTDGPLPGK